VALVAASPVGALFLGEWGGAGVGDGEFNAPSSVITDGSNNVYVADSGNNRIQKFTEFGEFLTKWGSAGAGPGQFSTPESLTTDFEGNVYVADTGNNRIEKFSPSGEFLIQWGKPGSGPGNLNAPRGIAVDPEGNVFVADTGNNRIEKFSPSGEFLIQWGGAGSGPRQFNTPDGIATNQFGDLYVADSNNHRIQQFNGLGDFLREWGSAGLGPGAFGLPVGVGTDHTGKVYVADSVNNQIQKFTPSGEFLSLWGETGSKPNHFLNPVSVAASFSARIYVADTGNNRIEAYGKIPAPEFGKTFNVGPVRGKVRFRPPRGKKFRRLFNESQLKVGSTIDATGGKARLTSAKNRTGETQSAVFYSGLFKVLQKKKGRAITELRLEGALDCRKRAKGSATASRRRSRKLWGSGRGNFRSRGRHGAATVRGTIWLTQDRCDGTLFRVKRGVVTVQDFTRHRKVKVRHGMSYLAPAG
jgi:DNA-binding beta-propeller fold protein YncE